MRARERYNTLSLPSDDTHAAEYLYAAVQDAGYDSVDQVLVTDGEAGRSNSVVFCSASVFYGCSEQHAGVHFSGGCYHQRRRTVCVVLLC